MTRRQLARALSKDIMSEGPHYIQGSTVWRTIKGDWGADPGTAIVPRDTLFYAVHAWRPTARVNTVLSVEQYLAKLEHQHTGTRIRINQKSLKVKA